MLSAPAGAGDEGTRPDQACNLVAWLPCWLIRDRVRSGTLIPLLSDVPSMEYVTYALWPQTPHLPLRVRIALDALTAALPGTTDL